MEVLISPPTFLKCFPVPLGALQASSIFITSLGHFSLGSTHNMRPLLILKLENNNINRRKLWIHVPDWIWSVVLFYVFFTLVHTWQQGCCSLHQWPALCSSLHVSSLCFQVLYCNSNSSLLMALKEQKTTVRNYLIHHNIKRLLRRWLNLFKKYSVRILINSNVQRGGTQRQ